MRGEERLPSATEADIYRSLDLPWIPPEIREAQGEIEAARAGRLPALLESKDLRGELHLHVAPSVDGGALSRLAESAHHAGLGYIGLVPESDAEAVRLGAWAANRTSPRVLVGREVKLGEPVPRAPAAPSFVVWSAVGTEPPSLDQATPLRGPMGWLGHLGGDPESATGPRRLAAWVDWATAAKMPLEVTSGPGYDGLDAVSLRRFTEAKGQVVVSELGCGAERTRALAVGTARRAWVTKASVLNAAEWP